MHTFSSNIKWNPHIHVLIAEYYLNNELKKIDFLLSFLNTISYLNLVIVSIPFIPGSSISINTTSYLSCSFKNDSPFIKVFILKSKTL